MAKAADPEPSPEPAAAPPASPLPFVLGVLVATVLAICAGGLFGYQIIGGMQAPAVAKQETQAAGAKGRFSENTGVRALAPIVTNLAGPERTWIRLEAAIVLDSDPTVDLNLLSANLAEDLVAFLRTVPLSQIEGAGGFQNLREDLNDRVRVRSGGKVRDFLIQALIVE